MPKLSAQLSELSGRVAKAEDVIAAAQDRDRQRLEAQRAELQSSVQSGKEHAAAAGAAAASWWSQTRGSADDWFAGQRAKAAQRREDHDLKKATHQADEAEADAADAVDFAAFALDQAQYAIIDAVLARADADALAADALVADAPATDG